MHMPRTSKPTPPRPRCRCLSPLSRLRVRTVLVHQITHFHADLRAGDICVRPCDFGCRHQAG